MSSADVEASGKQTQTAKEKIEQVGKKIKGGFEGIPGLLNASRWLRWLIHPYMIGTITGGVLTGLYFIVAVAVSQMMY